MDSSLSGLVFAAYAVEQKSLDMLEEELQATSGDAQKQIRSHIVETKWQIELLKACLGQIMDAPGADRPGLFSLKRFEIELYKKILAVAREQKATDLSQACKEILEQERAMAEWLEDRRVNVP